MTPDLGGRRLAILVHEVRSPVAALLAINETLAAGEFDPGTRCELRRLVLDACRAIERIVSDAAVVSVVLEIVDPARVAHDVVAAARLRGVDVAAAIPGSLPRVDADRARLRQAIENLVTNAVVHGKGPVVVSAAAFDRVVRISVSDDGGGIHAEERERIFEPGTRLGARAPGEGLGLALARAIVEAHGGALDVTSSPEEGTSFTIELPRRTGSC